MVVNFEEMAGDGGEDDTKRVRTGDVGLSLAQRGERPAPTNPISVTTNMVPVFLKANLHEYEATLMKNGAPWLEVGPLKDMAKVVGEKRSVPRDKVKEIFYGLMERHSQDEVEAGRPPLPPIAFDGGQLCYAAGGEIDIDREIPAAKPMVFEDGDERTAEEKEAIQARAEARRTTIRLRYIKTIPAPENGVLPADPSMRASLVSSVTAFIRKAVAAREPKLFSAGSAYFGVGLDGKREVRTVGNGHVMLPGIRSVVQAKQGGLLLSLDVTGAFFYRPCGLIEFLEERLGRGTLSRHWRDWSESDKRNLFKALRSGNKPLKLITKAVSKPRGRKDRPPKATEHQTRGRSWNDLFTEQAADGLGGWHKDRADFTVANYFESTDRRLKYPNLPCLDFSQKRKAKDGTEIVKLDWIPLEALMVAEGQQVAQGELTGRHTADMIKLCAVPPSRSNNHAMGRVQMLTEEAQRISQTLSRLGLDGVLSTGTALMDIAGDRLDLPKLVYANGRMVQMDRNGGDWQKIASNMAFYNSTPKDKDEPIRSQWAVLIWSRPPQQDFNNFLRAFIEGAQTYMPDAGIANAGAILEAPGREVSNTMALVDFVKAKLRDLRPRFIVNVISGRKGDGTFRPYLMDVLDNNIGVPCLHVRDDTLRKASGRGSSSMQNILMKLNGRLGGTCHAVVHPRASPSDPNFPVACFPGVKKPLTMVFGADVGHGAPGGNARSIVALVGSVDSYFSQYVTTAEYNSTGYQGSEPGLSRVEVIVLLKKMALTLLRQFYEKNNKQLPNAVVMVRDGVSEGEINPVLNIEVQSIIDALKEASSIVGRKDYNPDISYVVCVKSSNVRLMGKDSSGDRNGNITAGTMVDGGVTSLDKDDFMLSSHIAIQGTSSAKRYCVLHNQSSMSTQDLRAFIFGLCHTYSRCPRSVSLPAPTYYSRLVFTRMQNVLSSRNIRLEADAIEAGVTGGNLVPLGGEPATAQAETGLITHEKLAQDFKPPDFPVQPVGELAASLRKMMFW